MRLVGRASTPHAAAGMTKLVTLLAVSIGALP